MLTDSRWPSSTSARAPGWRCTSIVTAAGSRVRVTSSPRLATRVSPVLTVTEVRGPWPAPVPPGLPDVVERTGIDVEPLDVRDPDVQAWLAACVRQEIRAVTRFQQAVEVVIQHPVTMVRDSACEVLPGA